jgi:hypothetical protein
MDKEEIRLLAEALNNVAAAIRYLGDRIAEDEALNFSIGRGLKGVAEAISQREQRR